MKSSDLDGRICGSCEKLIRPGTVKTGGGYHFHGDHVVFESQCEPAAAGAGVTGANRAGLAGTICGKCGKKLEAREISAMKGGGAWHYGSPGHAIPVERSTTVRNSRAAAATAPRLARSRRSKTRRSNPHGGGRPRSFIAALVVEHAAKLFAEQRRWSYVLEELRSSGNGTYARNTLIRRVSEYSSAQNSGSSSPAAAARRRRRRPSKTSRRKVASR